MSKQANRSLLPFIGAALITLAIILLVWKFFFGGNLIHSKENVAGEYIEQPKNVLFHVSGSNSIGEKLLPDLLKSFMEKEGYEAVKIVQGEIPEEKWVMGNKKGETDAISIHAAGSSEAFKDLASKKAEIGLSSRKINEAEIAQLSTLGNMTSHECEHILAMDGIAIIVPGNNPLKSLSKDQIAQIFSGSVTNWSQISDSKAGAINLYARDKQSGTYESFKATVLGGSDIISNVKWFKNGKELSDAVSQDANGIGFVAMNAVFNNKALAIADAKDISPFYPTPFTISTEDYPLSRRLYMYTAAQPQSQLVKEFIGYALSDEGENVVSQTGFVGLSMQANKNASREIVASAGNIPTEYLQAIGGAARENVDFRFQTGSSNLDNKALDDLDRLAKSFAKPEMRGKTILLLGFTDSQGNDAANRTLAKNRVDAVWKELRSRGLLVSNTYPLGNMMPVASNANPLGREKNRRVEVWVK